MPRLAERADALINPLMLKETFQGFRSGALRLIAALALLVPLIIVAAFIGVVASENRVIEDAGRNLFVAITTALIVLGWMVAPVRAAQQLQSEIKSHTIELILLTPLSPWQLAIGRFQAAVLQIALLFAFTLPFQVSCIAIGGVGVAVVAGTFGLTLVFSLFQCSAALTGATTYLFSRRYGGAATFVALTYGFSIVGAVLPYARGSVRAELVAWFIALLALHTLLFLRLAADLLTPKGMRSFAWSKAFLAALLALFFLPLWAGELIPSAPDTRVQMLGAGLGLLYLLGIAWSAAPASHPRSAPLWRRLFEEGFDATLAYCGVITALVAVAAAMRGWPAVLPLLFFVYFVFLSGVGALVHALLPATVRTTQAYVNTMSFLIAIELVGTIVTIGLLENSGRTALVQALGLVFPIALHDLRLDAAAAPGLVTPVLIGAAAILLARERNARSGHG